MLYFVTENKPKFDNANIVLKAHDIILKQKAFPLIEIQSHSLLEIAKYKARQAFDVLKKPLVVKDDGWYFTSLNGFPGSYMKYINEWLSADDLLRLLAPYKNREIIFRDGLCYCDGKIKKVFTSTIKGHVLKTPKGKGVSCAQICTFRKDEKTMAECINEGIHFADADNSVWHKFAKWYKNL